MGRARELGILSSALDEALGSHGRLVLVTGEAGIGKTRLAAELAAMARSRGALVLWGAAYEGESAPPYNPFAEALTSYIRGAELDALRADLGLAAAPLARLVPAVRERLANVPDPTPLEPDEERHRLFDAISQFLAASARRVPIVLVVDDLHWADASTIALLRHVARSVPAQRLLLIGIYRDSEVDRAHPLSETLGTLRRESGYARVALIGLDSEAVGDLLQHAGGGPLSEQLISAIARDTQGNPFFALELLRHLEEQTQSAAALATISDLDLERIGVPDGVRHTVGKRLVRLSTAAHSLLQAAAAADGAFRLAVTAVVAELDDEQALDAIDEGLAAHLVAPTGADSYAFTHALVRHTLYNELNPSRRLRLHRSTAEALERVHGESLAAHAADIAEQYRLSAALPGAERGVEHAFAAAGAASAAAAHDRVAAFLQLAIDLMRPDDLRRPRALARLTLARTWALQHDSALAIARDTARALADTEGEEAAADFLCGVIRAMNDGGFFRGAAELTPLGLEYIGARRTLTWVRLKDIDIALREAAAGAGIGVPLDTPERREVRHVFRQLRSAVADAASNAPAGPGRPVEAEPQLPGFMDFALGGLAARLFEDVGAGIDARALDGPDDPFQANATSAGLGLRSHPELRHTFIAGDYRNGLPLWREWAEQAERTGRIGAAVAFWASTFRLHTALGEFAGARAARSRAAALAARLSVPSMHTSQLVAGEDEWRMAHDEDWDQPMTHLGPGTPGQRGATGQSFYGASTWASIARLHARVGRIEPALRRLASIIPAIEQAPGWAENYVRIICDAAETLWLTRRTDWIETIERNLRDKVVRPDFRYPMMDSRLALARLCALHGRADEAIDWFARARNVLDEQEARPLRAIVDYDEALMFVRRSAPGDAERARTRLDAALAGFLAIGMSGWVRRAEHLRDRGREYVPATNIAATAARAAMALSGPVGLLRDGKFWTLSCGGASHRLKDSRGLRFLAHLLRNAGQEFHVLDLIGLVAGEPPDPRAPRAQGGAGALLDDRAKSAYRARVEALREDIEEAERFNDRGRAERAREELEAISEQLAAAVGLGGRNREAASAAERARSTVTQRIKDAIRKIGTEEPTLGGALSRAVKTGTFCVYRADAGSPITWHLD